MNDIFLKYDSTYIAYTVYLLNKLIFLKCQFYVLYELITNNLSCYKRVSADWDFFAPRLKKKRDMFALTNDVTHKFIKT